jgi:signal peptidase II
MDRWSNQSGPDGKLIEAILCSAHEIRVKEEVLAFLSKPRFIAQVFFAVIALDQATKWIVEASLPLGASWPGEGFFQITHVANTGIAFGLFSGNNSVLILPVLLGIGMLVLFYRAHPNPGVLVRLSLGLMLAGALGNLIDRLRVGWVTDFLSVGPFYIFNVADSAIVMGVIILGAAMVFQKDTAPEPVPEQQDVAPPPPGS